MMSYLTSIRSIYEGRVTRAIQDRFVALVIDGWKCGETHYMSIIATFLSRFVGKVEILLLPMSLKQYETSQSAKEH